MNGVAEDEDADEVVEEADDSGPVYADDEIVLVVAPMPRLIVFVLAEGVADERLVV
jgi:hypothetical protein